MAFVLEKTPKPGEPGRDFYDYISKRTNHLIPTQWIVDKEKGIAFFYISNNSRDLAVGDDMHPKRTFTMIGKDFEYHVHEEIIEKERKSDDCLLLKINLRLGLMELTAEFWNLSKKALTLYGDHGVLSDYSKFELIVLNDDTVKKVKQYADL